MIPTLCRICGSQNVVTVYKKYAGYVEGTWYDIFNCSDCNTNFVDADGIDKTIYEKIYSSSEIEGYEKYLEFSNQVKDKKNPLKYLALQSSVYYPVYSFLKGKRGSVLDVGCGYGYLTYSLHKAGFDAHGIDLSENAIIKAREKFGDLYSIGTIESLRTDGKKYDYIVSTEVIEHLDDPIGFIRECLGRLKQNGQLFLTTPNKGFFKTNAIWFTDLPPVHKFWFSKESFKTIAKKEKLVFSFLRYYKYFPKYENRLVRFIRYQNEYIQTHAVDKTFKKYEGRTKIVDKGIRGMVKNFFLKCAVMRFISNLVYNLTLEKDETLAVVLWKK